MKLSLAAVISLTLVACDASPARAQQKLLLLPDGQVQVDGSTSDLVTAIKKLGPPDTTQINITGCSATPFATVQAAKDAIEQAGYGHIGFATAKDRDLALCQAGR
jgi:biopolymer transport protein ExbD